MRQPLAPISLHIRTMSPHLYFIALIPEKSFSDKIRVLQEELKEKFGLNYAMRIPPHITLQAPFECRESDQLNLNACIAGIKKEIYPIRLTTASFGSFIESVIYVGLQHSTALIKMQRDIVDNLESAGCLVPAQRNNQYLPHITLAHRDLDNLRFPAVWSHFAGKKLNETFAIERLVIYKHEEGRWLEFISLPMAMELA
ncbi:MAG: 2'-5' RNA ligase family protein [Bacteroidia bacterium]